MYDWFTSSSHSGSALGDAEAFIFVPVFRCIPTIRTDLSARMLSELIIKELSELQAGKGIWKGWGMDMWEGL